MTQETLCKEYFEWIYGLVCRDGRPYRKLLRHLDGIEFTYTIPMDDNRAADGIDLRYIFGYENKYHSAVIAEYLDVRPCSVLEMMVALCNRCEVQIMDNPTFGNRTERWFMDMIRSLGLEKMTDDNFYGPYVDSVIERFLNHDYEPNGRGSLFTVNQYRRDMRLVEIWYQMCWYLNEVLEKEKHHDY